MQCILLSKINITMLCIESTTAYMFCQYQICNTKNRKCAFVYLFCVTYVLYITSNVIGDKAKSMTIQFNSIYTRNLNDLWIFFSIRIS